MKAKVSFKLNGRATDNVGRDLQKLLREQSAIRQKLAESVVSKYLLLIQGEAKRQLNMDPRRIDDGTLRASIQTAQRRPGSGSLAKIEGAIYTLLEYAAFVHWGTGIYGENPQGGHRTTSWVYFDEKHRVFRVTRGMEANMFLLKAFQKYEKAYIAELTRVLGRPKQ